MDYKIQELDLYMQVVLLDYQENDPTPGLSTCNV